MKTFKVNRYQQVKIWMAQDIYFDAESLEEAIKLAKNAQENNCDIKAEIVEWGKYEYEFETEEPTGHYDWTDDDIANIEEC